MAWTRPARKAIIAIAASLICGALVAVGTHVPRPWTARVEAARLPGCYRPGAPQTGNQRAKSPSTGRSAPTAPRTWSSRALSRRSPDVGANG